MGTINNKSSTGQALMQHYFCFMCINIPLDRIMPGGLEGLDQRIIVITIRRTEQDRLFPGDFFDFFIAGRDLRQHFLAGQRRHMGMSVGVVHHLIARVRQGFDRFGIFVHPLSHHKKCRMDMMLVENVDQLRRIFVPPCRVKTDAHHLVRAVDAVDRQFFLSRHRRDHMRDQIDHGGNQGNGQRTDCYTIHQ